MERAFGILKRRFFINSAEYRIALNAVSTAILACCVLHNIAIELKMPEITEEKVMAREF